MDGQAREYSDRDEVGYGEVMKDNHTYTYLLVKEVFPKLLLQHSHLVLKFSCLRYYLPSYQTTAVCMAGRILKDLLGTLWL